MSGLKTMTVLAVALSVAAWSASAGVTVSKSAPRYFEKDGRGWIPTGVNICFARNVETKGVVAARAEFEGWIASFAENGGDYVRLWLGNRFFEVMPEKPGEYDPVATETLLRVVRLCEKLGVKLKLTVASFRTVNPADWKGSHIYSQFFNRPLYSGIVHNMREFYASEKCREIYLGKVKYLKSLGLDQSPAVICWELWNEINATGGVADYAGWSDFMLGQFHALFPNQLAVQNLGSYSDPWAYRCYQQLGAAKGNDFLQVHRYLDPGAQIDVCRGPMDVLAAQSVRDLWNVGRPMPILLAETGAVKANHTGPSVCYDRDKEGTLLHDALFAPFFAGAAGCGQFWHWDCYIHDQNLWWHFRRFRRAIEGLDPVAEDFRPFYTETDTLRIYGLQGRKTTVAWCRDKQCDWQWELVDGKPVRELKGERVPFGGKEIVCYLPWEDREVVVKGDRLPAFRRSIVLRFPSDSRFEDVFVAH